MSDKLIRGIFLLIFTLGGIGLTLAGENKPVKIRIGVVGNPYGKPFGTGIIGVLQEQKTLEAAFRIDGIAVEWEVFKGTGPAINEAFAAGALDIASYGDLPSILARSAGLKTRLVAASGRSQNIYVGVPTDSPFQSLADLKGKRVSTLRGTYMHLAFNKVIKDKGWTEKDFRFLNLNPAEGYPALASKNLEAYVGPSAILDLKNQGKVKIIYSTKEPGTPDEYRGFSAVVVTEDFLRQYPAAVKVFLREWAKAAAWTAEKKNFPDYLRINAKSGTSEKVIQEDLANEDLRWDGNPLLDEFYLNQLTQAISFSRNNNLLKAEFSAQEWAYPALVTEAVKEAGLDHFWDKPLAKK